MAIQHEVEFISQNSVYYKVKQDKERKIKTYYSLPSNGVNEDTGILLFIAGFGANSNSNIYKKMRNKFADEYNLVTIQCDYFGWEFMQGYNEIKAPKIDKDIFDMFTKNEINEFFVNNKLDFNKFLEIAAHYNIILELEANGNENSKNFNDMGIMQAIDNITAVLSVINTLNNNGYIFNKKKIISYGHSHGAYLSYLCNAFAPTLFSLIIDNSSWLYPRYMHDTRILYNTIGQIDMKVRFDYLAKKIIKDTKILDLKWLYCKFENNCNIISYHGTTDKLISYLDKKEFCNNIKKCKYQEISENKIDNVIFKSTSHGLNADFIKLFEYTMKNEDIKFEKSNSLYLLDEVIFCTEKNKYIINYCDLIPKISISKI